MNSTPIWLFEDEFFELRELFHLSQNHSFKEFFSLPYESISRDNAAVVGRAGFLFIASGSNQWQKQILGEAIISEGLLNETVALLSEMDEKLKIRNIKFKFLVVPEKDIIYEKLSPNASTGISKERSIHHIVKNLPNGFVIYPSNELLSAKELGHVFHARDSHINLWGAGHIINTLLTSLGVEQIDLYRLQTETLFKQSDLSAKWVGGLQTRKRVLSRSLYSQEVIIEAERHTGKYMIFRSKQPKINETAMIFGDSYSWNLDAGLARLLACAYQEVHFVWSKQIDWNLVDSVKPDLFILQSAERYLIQGIK